MRSKAYGKINWSLAVYDKREDGYHEIDSVMQKVSLADMVTLHERAGEMALRLGGSLAAGVPTDESNLAWRAAERYRQATNLDVYWEIEIEKEIPHGAGLGGASADAAAVLSLLEKRYGCLGEERLFALATSLGADIPFLLSPHMAARCGGLGEKVVSFPAKGSLPLILAMGRQRVSTAKAYAGANPRVEANCMEVCEEKLNALQHKLIAGNLDGVGGLLFNDLQEAAEILAPEITLVLKSLRSFMPLAAAMTGSGATCFALFRDEETMNRAAEALKEQWAFIYVCHTLGKAEGSRRQEADR